MSIERTLPAQAITAVVNDLRHGQSELPRRQPMSRRDSRSQEITLSDTRLQVRSQDVDGTRVAQLQQAIGQGKLIMDSGRVADALLINAWQN
ncbi:flagellar biosynthesis anti-sigma factor FlgM [Sodalis sp.]|uniref:flagellar biosynthesis anti-sigma factor FlgM n=1 Tax=Sodalis sp. (in: enterobacteria) TaxID=1898979 RepID=UPI0038739D58